MKKFILGILACIAILAAAPAYAAYGGCAFGDCSSGSSGSGGSTIAGLTTNKLTKATSATGIGNSQVFDDGTNVGVGSNIPTAKLDVAGVVHATSFQSSGSTAGVLQLFEASANGTNYINWTSPSSLSANSNYTWPSAVGTAGQVLTASDSSGGINWSSIVQGSGGSVNWASITGDQRTGNWTAISPYINTGAINWQSVYTVNQSVNWGTGFQQADSFNATGTGNTYMNKSSGNVGIGTAQGTTLSTKLYVVGTGTFTTGLNIGIGTASPTRLCIANNAVTTCN